MRAIEYDRFGSYDVLQLIEAPRPVPTDGQVLVRITVAGVNPLDETVRSGKLASGLRKQLPIRPGGFGVGRVEEPGTSGLNAGERVVLSGGRYGVSADGSWAEYIAVEAAHLVRIPDGVDDETAAALTTGAGHLTAHLALNKLAGFRRGQSVLAPGVGGAVGQGGVEVARVLGASLAITTATTTEKARLGRSAGYEVIDLSSEALRDGVARLTNGRGVDVVLDGIGGSVTGEALGSLAVDGTLISIGYAADMRAGINVTDLIWKNAHIHGFRFALFASDQVNAANTILLGLASRGELQPKLSRSFPLEKASEAQRHLAEGSPFGRVILTL
jgi:NADPH2:quinone reductase